MHIPDGFLSTPVWAALDAAALPAAGLLARRAQRDFEESRVPLLGVMGAFVFAAQMINFPVGVGTSGHLLGAALLGVTVGPAAASVVMTAILAIQALVFQDGGILALGANVWNMAIAGVLAGWLPYRLWGAGRRRRWAVFAGGALSVASGALLALAELLISGIPMPQAAVWLSVGLFAVTAVIEGAITVAVVEGIERLNPGLVLARPPERPWRLAAIGTAAALLAAAGVLFASTAPDGVQRLAERAGIAGRARQFFSAPFADYQLRWFSWPWLQKAAAGLAGLVLIYAICVAVGRFVARQRSA